MTTGARNHVDGLGIREMAGAMAGRFRPDGLVRVHLAKRTKSTSPSCWFTGCDHDRPINAANPLLDRICASCSAAIPAHAQEIIDLPAEDRTLELALEELYRLGTLAGEEWEQFGDVQSVAFDAAGNLLVFDQHDLAQKIYVVDPEGRLVREMGGRGEGPGEFGKAVAMAVMPDGRVVVSDLPIARATISSPQMANLSAWCAFRKPLR